MPGWGEFTFAQYYLQVSVRQRREVHGRVSLDKLVGSRPLNRTQSKDEQIHDVVAGDPAMV
jgi:hypothetical protein